MLKYIGCTLLWIHLFSLQVQCQIMFTMEPPARLSFSNSTGAAVTCSAHGTPTPHISWIMDDGSLVNDIPGLRTALPNGTLLLLPFSPSQYRRDIHSVSYKCRVANVIGTVISRSMHVDAVMDTYWSVSLLSSHTPTGGTSLLTCSVSAQVKRFTIITNWYKNGLLITTMPDSGENFLTAGNRNEHLLVRNIRKEESVEYSCESQNTLTGVKKRSDNIQVTISDMIMDLPPRMIGSSNDEVVDQGTDTKLYCCAVGRPTPSFSWHRQKDGILVPVTSSIRISLAEELLIIRRVRTTDSGTWVCIAHNILGQQRQEISLRVRIPLSVQIQPQLQIANSGSTVSFNCSVSSDADVHVRWMHDGIPVISSGRTLQLIGVSRAHKGMYQCIAQTHEDIAQSTAELRLGDTSPELHYTFIEQTLHPGPLVVLHCTVSGSPPPRFTWLLDGQTIEETNKPERSISQYINNNGDVVSYLNITSARTEDGGRYTCRAKNSRGTVEHSARLNIYGPPSIRNNSPIKVVAGTNVTVYCPYSGYPIRWQRETPEVEGDKNIKTSVDGGLLLWPAELRDAATYSCYVTSPSGHYAQKHLQIIVKQPPNIVPFNFPRDLVEGSSVQVLCGLTAGDKPIYFSWLKDGKPISPNLNVNEKSLDEFSFLVFSKVRSEHSGDYTCVAANSAAEVNHTAQLTVKVAPSWKLEPHDLSTLLGDSLSIQCEARGHPEPLITWFKMNGDNEADIRPILNGEMTYTIMRNGSLNIHPASRHHEGKYICKAENGIGRGLSKVIQVDVNEPAYFEYSSKNVTIERGVSKTLNCDVKGDLPIKLHWTRDNRNLELSSYRIRITEIPIETGIRSQLTINRAERQDSGVYRCLAQNAFGRDELVVYFSVLEAPEPPHHLKIKWSSSRSVLLRWRSGYDGNTKVLRYRLQYRPVSSQTTPAATSTPPDWRSAQSRDIPAHLARLSDRDNPNEDVLIEYMVEGLKPATAYLMRLLSANSIAESAYSDPIIVKTSEEVPAEPPHNVQVIASASGEITVKWKTPTQETWNGELLGYVVSWKETGLPLNLSRFLSIGGWMATEAVLSGLKPATQYEIRVRAFNSVGAGPASSLSTIVTLEGVPEFVPIHVWCEPMTSQSIRLWWEILANEQHKGTFIGYEITYELENDNIEPETRIVGGSEVLLQGLRPAANYSIYVKPRTNAGVGRGSDPTYCLTQDDVPGPPADVKVLAASENSVLVCWLPPLQKNGRITMYTVYSRPAGRIGQNTHQTFEADDYLNDYSVEIKHLQEYQLYEFWVTASTVSGESKSSAIIAGKPNSRVEARISSFGGKILRGTGNRAQIDCRAVGLPVPHRTWTRTHLGVPLLNDQRIHIDDTTGILTFNELAQSLSDNYTCHVRNSWGDDTINWDVRVLSTPSKPHIRLVSSTSVSLHLAWDSPNDGGSYIFDWLVCGTKYKVRLRAFNTIGAGEYSSNLVADTKGGLSKPPNESKLISTNSTCLRLNLFTWFSSGCPITEFTVSIKPIAGNLWSHHTTHLDSEGLFELCNLIPTTWYNLKVVASSPSGNAEGRYHFATLDMRGEKIKPPAFFPSFDDENSNTLISGIIGISTAVFFITLISTVISVLIWHRSRMGYICFSKEYHQSSLSEDDYNESIEKRDNQKNCQQVYTSSPIKKANDKDQEMYEISPYATFSMSGNKQSTPGGTLQLRTFGRVEEVGLQAPARPNLEHHGKHRSISKPDEYTLSRAMTLMVRRSDSESESSGSSAAAYRLPQVLDKDVVFRPVTDSSAESQIECSVRVPPDKRRRTRRHHTPTNSRCDQHTETERRDFTIHV